MYSKIVYSKIVYSRLSEKKCSELPNHRTIAHHPTMLSNFISRGARSAAHYQVNVSRPLSILKHGLSAVELEEELGRFPSVKLRGLPYNTSIDDLAEFLKGLNPIDIVVPKANDNGILGVLFSSTEDADAAMRRDKDSIGTRYIDVIRIPRVEYYRMAQDSISRDYGEDGNGLQALANMQGADEGSVVKMTGIPFQATAIDVQKFFDGEIKYEQGCEVCGMASIADFLIFINTLRLFFVCRL